MTFAVKMLRAPSRILNHSSSACGIIAVTSCLLIQKGTVRKWIPHRGFGFIEDNLTHTQIFVHNKDLVMEPAAFRSLHVGQHVEYDAGEQDGRACAVRVTTVGGLPLPASDVKVARTSKEDEEVETRVPQQRPRASNFVKESHQDRSHQRQQQQQSHGANRQPQPRQHQEQDQQRSVRSQHSHNSWQRPNDNRKEEHPAQPRKAYGVAKVASSTWVEDF